MPATLQNTIAARIDRLRPEAKQTLSAASVIGLRFGAVLAGELASQPVSEDLLLAELIDQVQSTPRPGVRVPPSTHPRGGVRDTAAVGPGRTASAVGVGDRAGEPDSLDKNAAILAEHLQAAGSCTRPTAGTCAPVGGRSTATSWLHASAGQAPARSPMRCRADDPARSPMRIAPLTLLCLQRVACSREHRRAAVSTSCDGCASWRATRRPWRWAWRVWSWNTRNRRRASRGVGSLLRGVHGPHRLRSANRPSRSACPSLGYRRRRRRRWVVGSVSMGRQRHRPGRR